MNFGQTAKSVLATVAPLIGTALGGPFGGLAGTLLSKALGTNDPKAMEAAITSTDPDILLKLKQADNDFQAQMKALEISEEKLTFDDIANARARETSIKDSTPRNLAYMLLIGTGIAIGATLAGYTHVDSALAGTLIGYLISECKAVMQYYFGSSAGSAAKTDAINQVIAAK